MSDDEPGPGSVENSAESVLAGEIRRHRELADLSRTQLATRVGYSREYVSRAERPGKGLASADLVRSIDTALQAGGVLTALHAQATTERRARRLPARTTSAASTLPADDGRSAPAIVGSTVSDRPDTVPALLTAAGDESARFLEWSERENVGELSIEGMQAELLRVTRTYLAVPTLPLFKRTRLLRDRVFGLLEGRQRPLRTRDLYAIAGWSMTVLAWMSTDLDDPYSAEEHLRAAWGCAEYADHDGLRAWVRATQHTTSFWQKHYADAARYAEDGLRYARYAPNGTAGLFLAGAYAIDTAKLGDRHGAVRALRDARDRVDRVDSLDDELAGPFTCTFSRAAGGLWSDAYLELDQPAEALRCIELAYPVGVTATGDRNLGSERMALCQKAKTYLVLGEHDGAAEVLAPALETAVDLRARPLVERVSQIGHLARSLDKHSASSADIVAATDAFVEVGHCSPVPANERGMR